MIKNPIFPIISLFFGILISNLILSFFLSDIKINTEEDLLNPGTSTLFEKINNKKIHCKDSRDINECFDSAKSSGFNENVLWLGNSQIHALNQYKEGQPAAPSILHNNLRRDSLNLITMSFGNANLQEHMVQYAHIVNRLSLKYILLGIVFDDTREDGIRKNVYDFINEDLKTKKLIESYDIGRELIKKSNYDTSELSLQKENEKNLQNKIEPVLNEALGSISFVWKMRSEIAYRYFVFLRRVRNYIFNINPSTIRKIIPDTYKRNLSSLEMMMDISSKNNILMIAYIAPIRSDIKIPYDLDEYNNFKITVKNMSLKYPNVFYENLEDIIKSEYWGLKNSTTVGEELELDFMHFNADAHKVLSEKLYNIINTKNKN
tara:strand:- start:6720 stop:7847 length:1128 start_codon:yes stop_codon:yes gene_type:complete